MAEVELATDVVMYAWMTPTQRSELMRRSTVAFACISYAYLLTAPTAAAAAYAGGSIGVDDALLVAAPVLSFIAAITGIVMIIVATTPLAVKIIHYITLLGATAVAIAILSINDYNGKAEAPFVYGLILFFSVTAATSQFVGGLLNNAGRLYPQTRNLL